MTFVQEPMGLAVDWVSGNLFISDQRPGSGHPGSGRISVCKLDGAFFHTFHNITVDKVTHLAVDPYQGTVYFIDVKSGDNSPKYIIGGFHPTREVFKLADSVKNPELNEPSHLTIDLNTRQVYWINLASGLMQYYSQATKSVHSLRQNSFSNRNFFGLAIYENYIYYGINETLYRRQLQQDDGQDDVVTNDVLGATSALIYSRRSTRRNSCKNIMCAHLCLPISATTSRCACSEGYSLDPSHKISCVAASEVLVYSSQRGLTGFSITPNDVNTSGGLPIFSQLGAISHIAADVQRGLFVVADSDAGTISQMWRDGTNRKILVKGAEVMGVAIDPVAGNVYWSGGKSISVCRFNDTRQHVIIHELGNPKFLAVHPSKGKLFWTDDGSEKGIYSSGLDGSDAQKIIDVKTLRITGLTLDLLNDYLIWSDFASNNISRSNLEGNDISVIVEGSTLPNTPKALAVHNSTLFSVIDG